MKKTLLASLAVFAAVFSGFAQTLPESTVPAGVKVEPVPGSTVDTSPNQYPLGISSIGVTYQRQITPNRDNTEPAVLYYNDFNTPYATTLTASVDMMSYLTGGVIFKGTYTMNGVYKVEVPEGYFCYIDGVDETTGEVKAGDPTPAMTLYYRIYNGWTLQPAHDDVLYEIERIVLRFPEADKVEFGTAMSSTCVYPINGEDLGISYEIADVDGDGVENAVVISFVQDDEIRYNLSATGKYGLLMDPGAINYYVNGEKFTTTEIRALYHIPAAPEPDIWPSPAEPVTDGFEYFELTVPYGFDMENFFQKNTNQGNYIYPVNEDGTIDKSEYVAVAKVVFAECYDHYLHLALFDPVSYEPLNFEYDTHDSFQSYLWTVKAESRTPWFPAKAGRYALVLGEGLYSGYYTGMISGSTPEYVTNSPFYWIYDVAGNPSAVEEIEAVGESDTVTVYNLSGVCVARNADKSVVNTLPAGFYIVNGKKVVVK